jgi:hypothetical protein
MKDPYPQPYPSFYHGGFTSRSLYIEGISKVKGKQFRYQTFDFGGSIIILISRFMQGLDEDSLEK